LQENVTFNSDGLQLAGVVHIPDGAGPNDHRPAIVMMHGFGANKDGGPEWVCGQFESWGYVALRFDYRGCGDSGGERGRIIPAEEVADARNAITYLTSRPRLEPHSAMRAGSTSGRDVR